MLSCRFVKRLVTTGDSRRWAILDMASVSEVDDVASHGACWGLVVEVSALFAAIE